MKQSLRALVSSGFAKAAGAMLTGTVVAQAIPIAISPFLTRLYSPEAYGDYAKFSLAAYTISALASLRYEVAILNADDEDEADALLSLSLAVAILVSVVTFVVTLLLWLWTRSAGAAAPLNGTWLLLAGAVFVLSAFQALNSWQIRKAAFTAIARARVARALLVAVFNVALGILAFNVNGLAVGSVMGFATATVVLLYAARPVRLLQSRSTLYRVGRKHFRFAVFSVPADLLSTLTAQAPLLFLTGAIVGHFSFAMTVLGAPITLVSGAVHDAFKQRAAKDFRESGNFARIFNSLSPILAGLAIGPAIVLLLWGPSFFDFVFGARWRDAGEVARVLALMFAFKLVASPLSYAFFIANRQSEDLYAHLYIALSTFAIFIGARHYETPNHLTLTAYSANYCLFYAYFFIRSLQFSRGTERR
jgi:O-antigen/teichoic acid export membrane protein